MKKNLLFMLMSIMSFFYACNNDVENLTEQNEQENTLEEQTFSFTYKGKAYSSDYIVNDDVAVYSNKDVEDILKYLEETKPNLVTYEHPDGSIEYFDDMEDYEKSVPNLIKTRYYPNTFITHGYLTIYKDSKLKGNNFTYVAYNLNNWSVSVPELRSIGMGDEISSIKITSRLNGDNEFGTMKKNIVAEFYSDENYKGYTYVTVANGFLTSSTAHEIHYFKSLKPYGPYPNKNWNDRVDSFKFYLNEVIGIFQ